MAADFAEEWTLPLLFAAMGVVIGSFLTSAYPAYFRLKWLFSAFEVISADHRKTERVIINTSRKWDFPGSKPPTKEGHMQEFSESCQSHLNGYSEAPKHANERDECTSSLNSFGSFSSSSLRPASDRGNEAVQHSHGIKADPYSPSKRQGYLSWDDYFMAIAFLSAHRSKDPNRQVGACLVSQDRVILGIGYNGFPRGCSDDKLPWAKMAVDGDPLQTKYPYVCHAEVNAILNKNHASACGQRLYVTMFPCNECAKIIIQAGVAEVIYFMDKSSSSDCSYIASQKMLSMAGVKVRQHQPQKKKLILYFN